MRPPPSLPPSLNPDAGRSRIRTEDLWGCCGEQQKRISSIIQSHPSNGHQRQRPWVIFQPDKLLKDISVPKPFDSNLQPSGQKSRVKSWWSPAAPEGRFIQNKNLLMCSPNWAWQAATGRWIDGKRLLASRKDEERKRCRCLVPLNGFFGDFATVYNEESAFNIHEIDSRWQRADSRRKGLNLKRDLQAETQLFILFTYSTVVIARMLYQLKKDERVFEIHD